MKVWMALYVICMVYIHVGTSGENICLGSGCFCNEYPVKITCDNGYHGFIDKLVKHVAVEVVVDGDSVQDLATLDLDEFYSLKKLTVLVENDDVCSWIRRNVEKHPDIDINMPDFCAQVGDRDSGDDTVNNGGLITLQFGVKEIVTITFSALILALCTMARKCLK